MRDITLRIQEDPLEVVLSDVRYMNPTIFDGTIEYQAQLWVHQDLEICLHMPDGRLALRISPSSPMGGNLGCTGVCLTPS